MKLPNIVKKNAVKGEITTMNVSNNKETVAVMHKESQPVAINKNVPEFHGVHQVKDAVVFVASYPKAKTVQIAGDFNKWQPQQNPMLDVGKNGVWQLKLRLAPGTYRYRLVVDGQWQQDPRNNATEPNPYGGFNSVLTVS